MVKRSMPDVNIGDVEGVGHRRDDICLYKNVKLTKDIIGEDEEDLGVGPDDVGKERSVYDNPKGLLTYP
jgi:hypothetical protein